MGVYYPSIKNIVSRVDFDIALNYWLQEINSSLFFQSANAKLFDDILDMRDAMERGELDFVLAPPFLLAKYFNRSKLTDGFVGTALDGTDYGTVIVVRTESGILEHQNLTGKRLILPEHDELAEIFLDTIAIQSHKKHYRQVFTSLQSREKQSAIVLALFFNQADVGVVNKESYQLMIELNPQIKDRVKVFSTFPTKSPNYGYFSSAYPKDLSDRIIRKVNDLNNTARSQHILNDLRMNKLVSCPVGDLLIFDDLIRHHQSLQKGIKR
jgi:phosphonate transport system substrate-binding protein